MQRGRGRAVGRVLVGLGGDPGIRLDVVGQPLDDDSLLTKT
jgi:hypothetical protein